jgi:hypothetical protein
MADPPKGESLTILCKIWNGEHRFEKIFYLRHGFPYNFQRRFRRKQLNTPKALRKVKCLINATKFNARAWLVCH